MSTLPLIGVKDVEKTSQLLQKLFDWKSHHGGPDFEDLIDQKGRSVLWLHVLKTKSHMDSHERFKGALKSERGLGLSIYVLVEDIEKVLKRCKKAKVQIVEELFFNENAQFREFTLKIKDGFHFTVFEKGPYLNI